MCRTVAWVGPKRRCERGFGVEWSVGSRQQLFLRVIVSGSFGGRIALASHCIGSILLHVPQPLANIIYFNPSHVNHCSFLLHRQVLQAQYPYALSPQGPQEVLVRQLDFLQGQGRQAGP